MMLELHQLDLRYAGLRRRSAQRERALLASLSESGQQAPVVVVLVEGDRPVLVDGYKRVRALSRLRKDTVLATVWALPEAEALLLSRLMRSTEVDSPMEQGWLLRELCERFGLAASELAQRFDKSLSWVSRRLALVRELPESIQAQVREGGLQAHAAMKHLVPLARANRHEAEVLAAALGGRRLSTRDIGALCAAWRGGCPDTQALVLEKPEVVLRAQAEARAPREPLTPSERLLSDLSTLCAIARRASRLLRDEPPAGVDRTALGRAAERARADVDCLLTRCRKECSNAGRGIEERHLGAPSEGAGHPSHRPDDEAVEGGGAGGPACRDDAGASPGTTGEGPAA